MIFYVDLPCFLEPCYCSGLKNYLVDFVPLALILSPCVWVYSEQIRYNLCRTVVHSYHASFVNHRFGLLKFHLSSGEVHQRTHTTPGPRWVTEDEQVNFYECSADRNTEFDTFPSDTLQCSICEWPEDGGLIQKNTNMKAFLSNLKISIFESLGKLMTLFTLSCVWAVFPEPSPIPPGEPSHGLHDHPQTVELHSLSCRHSQGDESTPPPLLTLHCTDTALLWHLRWIHKENQ